MSKGSVSLNDIAWESLFEKYDILNAVNSQNLTIQLICLKFFQIINLLFFL